jgi:hypothetical protein
VGQRAAERIDTGTVGGGQWVAAKVVAMPEDWPSKASSLKYRCMNGPSIQASVAAGFEVGPADATTADRLPTQWSG